MKTFSIVVETENLGMAEMDDLEASLASIESQTLSVKKAKNVFLIVGSHVSEEVQKYLENKYPWITIHPAGEQIDYTRSKMLGAKICSSEIVVFADSDMRYESTWLENMLKTFGDGDENLIVSGDTRLETKSAYSFSLNLTWMIQLLSDKIDSPVDTYYFPLNNFAIHKDTMLASPIPHDLPLYRNKIPIWEKILVNKGCRVVRAPGTRGHHAPPGNFNDWLYRMMAYGADFVCMADFSVNKDSKITDRRSFIKKFYNFIFLFPWKVYRAILNTEILLRENTSYVKYIPLGLILAFVNIAMIQLGALTALFKRDYMFNLVTARELSHGV